MSSLQQKFLSLLKVRQFIIRLTRDSTMALKRNFQEKKLQVLMDVIEDHLLIDQFDGLPRTQQQIDAVAGGLLGNAFLINTTQIHFFVVSLQIKLEVNV